MSKSFFIMKLDFYMLDGRIECNPEYADSSGGSTHFSTQHFKLKCWGPPSWEFDGTDGVQYDKEKLVEETVNKLLREFTLDAHNSLKKIVGNLFDQAKKHCEEHHKDGTFGHKGH